MGGCSSRGSYHRMEARLSLEGTATSNIWSGQNVTASGGCGETEAAASERPVTVQKRMLFTMSRNSEFTVLEKLFLPNRQRVSLCRFKFAFGFLKWSLQREVEGRQGGIYLIDFVISEMYETRASS